MKSACVGVLSIIVPTVLRKILKYQISWKPVQWERSCCTRTDGQTWRS